ncbi:hypothetical protein GGS26DRAFT_441231 [Hypomontagnella submonticulosa]|nr:hypothetical protein GGS26DRAFT_441231 [Hypomontagnella submonticulosa]
MKSFQTVLACLLAMATMIHGVIGAACFSKPQMTFYEGYQDDANKAKELVCSQDSSITCENLVGDTMQCSLLYSSTMNGFIVIGWVGNKDNAMQYCNDAYTNIIGQCFNSGYSGGNYHWGSTWWLQPVSLGQDW